MKSTNLKDLYKIYGYKTAGELSPNEQHTLSKELETICKIENAEQAKKFLQLLALLREAETKSIDGLGPDAMATIIGAFAGGDEGVYAADTDLMNARFIFELVQNVDDCKYENVNECKLNIKFNVDEDKLVLEYNELGFQPENVMAITGLGNSTKNHKKARSRKAEEDLDQSDLQEIGEKGIGFKSIFGLAQKVNIKSRYFNFSIERDSFFVPVVGNYDDFEFSASTVLELTLDQGMVSELYAFLKNKYDYVEAIVNENPILFLNKLTEIQYYESEKDFFGFRVSRGQESEEYSEIDTTIEYFSSDKRKNKSIEAIRFSHQIEYSVDECRARYGNHEDSTRTHKVIVIAPKEAELIKAGRIYSFFATSEAINAPFIIHAPFRLNSGRTKIDSQSQGAVSKNAWFIRTRTETIEMIQYAYERLARLQKEKIRFYIPDQALVNNGCALYCSELKRNNILLWDIFEGIDGEFYPAHEVCLLKYKGKTDELIEIHELLSIQKVLANAPYNTISAFEEFGITIYEDVEERLLKAAIIEAEITEACCRYIKDFEPTFSLRQMGYREIYLEETQLLLFSQFEKITKWINKHTYDFLKEHMGARIETSIRSYAKSVDAIIGFCDSYGEAIYKPFVGYLKRVSYIEADVDNTIIANDCVIGRNMLEDFANIYHILVPKDKFFYPFLQIEAVSEEIDILCEKNEKISDYEFLKALSIHRTNQMKMLKEQYTSILDLIEKAGTSTERFFPEILQNVDDCVYAESPHVVIRCDKVKGEYKLYVEYNEVGFTREQIRAITAIGDSTKKKLLSVDTTGEKGVGFKSVFGLCNAVSIETGTVSFRLSADAPTVPKYVKEIKERKGTKMVFTLKPVFAKLVMDLLEDEAKLIRNCLCLKKVHSLVISQKEIVIKNTENRRKITCDKTSYEFYKYEHTFRVTNQMALYQRRKNKDVLQIQSVCYLIPLSKEYQDRGVYTTFPTLEEINVPMIVDMPLQLDTARERIQDSEWNKEIIRQMIYGLSELYIRIAPILGTAIVKYIPNHGKLLHHRYSEAPNLLSQLSELPLFKLAFANKYVSLSEGEFTEDIEYAIFEKYGAEYNSLVQDFLVEKDEEYFDRLELLFEDYMNHRTYGDICSLIHDLMYCFRQKNINLMGNKEFRDLLYDFLANSRDNSKSSIIKQWAIIPVSCQKKTDFVCYTQDIYAPGEGNLDSSKYRILDSKVMSEQTFNAIYAKINGKYETIKKFSKDIIIAEFYTTILQCLELPDKKQRANQLLDIYVREKDLFTETYKQRKDFPREKVLLGTRSGDIQEIGFCYLCKDNATQGCLDKVIVNDDFSELARLFEVNTVGDINNYKQLPFDIALKELKDLRRNKNLSKRTELFTSLYLCEKISEELLNGEGFFELYKLIDDKVKLREQQPTRIISVDTSVLKKFAKEINEISLGRVPISFVKEFELDEFEKQNLLTEIEDELQLRSTTDKLKSILYLLARCYYGDTARREPCCIKTEKERVLVFDFKVNAEYDIIEVLKAYLLKYFNTEISVNRNIRLYTRRGFENISTIVTNDEDVEAATNLVDNIDITNKEDVKDFVCRPILLNGVTYGGYAKTCPLCGARIDTELTGMRMYKTKCKNTIIPIFSCSNCHENLRYASSIEIDTDKLYNGILSMECMINDYQWRIDEVLIRLGHRALISYFNRL